MFTLTADHLPSSQLRDVLAYVDLDALVGGLFGDREDAGSDVLVYVFLAAVVADSSGDPADDDRRLAALEGQGDCSLGCFSLTANGAVHDFLLFLNPGSQSSGSGS